MSSSIDFDEAFSVLFLESGWREPIGPVEALRRWKSFSEDCLDGFPWDVDDYNNDLTLRTRLAETLPRLEEEGYDAARRLAGKIEESDSRVRVVLRCESFLGFPEDRWWLRRTPIYASKDFCIEFREAYGVDIEPKSRFDDDKREIARMKAAGMSALDVLIHVRAEGWYVSTNSGLFFRAFREAFPSVRRNRKLVLGWISGEVEEPMLRSSFSEHR
ncbi:hypothetical protein [Nocardiopsis ansamitocini]|uniref:Uncharacterized protein n=1 Tax=Nocardiopsis ansamitocini TaxID=1670832 RepID=A0A9W6PBM6_9ACTN|nr:hypothetical protein [Nocardiopsis ansamitocini]GLU50526.1 hypothetical protein Nans01_48770 [Nocardiopsis ansamitocini]